MRPQPGMVVAYVIKNPKAAGEIRPALITRTDPKDDTDRVNLVAVLDGTIDTGVGDDKQPWLLHDQGVPFDPNKSPGTWHYVRDSLVFEIGELRRSVEKLEEQRASSMYDENPDDNRRIKIALLKLFERVTALEQHHITDEEAQAPAPLVDPLDQALDHLIGE